MSRDPRLRIQDIRGRVASIRSAERVMERARLESDEQTLAVAVNSVLYDLVVIGEAVRAIPEDILATEPEVPWRLIVGMRNRLAHEYFLLRPELVGRTIDEPLQELDLACERLLEE